MKYIYKSLLTLIIITLFASCNTDSQANISKEEYSSSKISILKNNIDLKEIPIMNGKVEAKFSFKNEGDTKVLITDGETSCMCTEAIIKDNKGNKSSLIKMKGHGVTKPINKTVNPGETLSLIAIFDPMAHGPNATGPIRRDVILKTNSAETPTIRFSFSGNVIK